MKSRDDISRPDGFEKQYVWYRIWALLCFWVGVVPFTYFTVLWLVGRLGQVSLDVIFTGAMATALGLFTAACLYFDGVVPLRRESKSPPM